MRYELKQTKSTLLAFLSVGLLALSMSAQAAAPTEQLSVTVNGNGSVTSDPAGVACPNDCTVSFKRNLTVTLAASAASDSTFQGWSGACAGTAPDCVITRLSSATTVVANFTATVAVPIAPTVKTGISECYGPAHEEIACTGTGQDGEFRAGASVSPPRFTRHADGTVYDSLTGLTWAGQSCGGFTWEQAVAAAATLGNGACGLSDGSKAGDWRIPNVLELLSLMNWQTGEVAECNIVWSNGSCAIPSAWTSTPGTREDPVFWRVEFYLQTITSSSRSATINLIPVRK